VSASKVLGREGFNEQTRHMAEPDEPMLTLDEAYRATFHFIHQYYEREPIVPFMLLLSSMTAWSDNGNLRQTDDLATWHDWMKSVQAARISDAPLTIQVSPREA
jgi:hypothetical protein